MWSVVCASVIGTSHEAACVPCQDSCEAVQLRIGNEDVLVAAIADGAGSASHSHIGASEAVQHLTSLVTQGCNDPAEINHDQVKCWYETVLAHLIGVAERESTALDQLACTLLLVVAWKTGAVFAQIGDGAWVVEKDDVLSAATWPETGEYANVTVFLTTRSAIDHLQFQKIDGVITGIAGFTDGIQSITLDYAQRTPGSRFFNAMFGSLRTANSDAPLASQLRQMLASDVITSRTDDDKTLVLAVRQAVGVTGSLHGTTD